MERNIKINYSWWRDKNKSPFEKHIETLECHALEHITALMKNGYIEGELNLEIANTIYHGYWSFKIER